MNVLKSLFVESNKIFHIDGEYLEFKTKKSIVEYKIGHYEKKSKVDSCMLDGYTLSTESLFLEYLELDSYASWQGEAFSLYEEFFKRKLHIKTLELVEKKEFKNYSFYIYTVDDEFNINFIHIHDITIDIFIVDYLGELYTHLMREFVKDYHYGEYKKPFYLPHEISLIEDNLFSNHFMEEGD